ncbi:MAG: hypothetical protein GY847_08425 [Proteobacteria bacterium]|nr:hypothetical protein [Pseudomonadota bacterium]
MARLNPIGTQMLFLLLPLFFLVSLAAHAADPESSDTHNYMLAIRQELARLDIEVRCDDAISSCIYKKPLYENGPSCDVVLHYSKNTDTIYIYIDKFIVLPKGEGPSIELSHRLLELNREMVTAKFEWDKLSNSIRLSATINTDSNFDRRALRSQLIGLLAIAKKVRPSLSASPLPPRKWFSTKAE